jgi:hypothetical protein
MSELLPCHQQPPVAHAESAHVTRWAAYNTLAAEAAADYSGFWSRPARGFVSWETPFTKVLDESNAPFFKWFKDGTLRLVHLWELPVMNQSGASTARHEPGGWMRWPEYKDCRFQSEQVQYRNAS